ncbi:MAG: hypothetical protein HC768_20795 [Acaryochloris sp. CRU_2_0]|nr:hypothetical protein [Acaryochloris sp. CRU_2_0]
MLTVQWPRDNFWLYGAVEPLTGESFFYSFSPLDAVCFNIFLQLLSDAFPDSFNLLQLDHAKAHCAEAIDWPENVLPLFQPSHSPELNPVERLWQEMRKPFKGKIFEDLPQLQQSVFDELKALRTQKVPSLTGYSFILDALPI